MANESLQQILLNDITFCEIQHLETLANHLKMVLEVLDNYNDSYRKGLHDGVSTIAPYIQKLESVVDANQSYVSLNQIKELVERKSDELGDKEGHLGGALIGLYFSIANDLPSVKISNVSAGEETSMSEMTHKKAMRVLEDTIASADAVDSHGQLDEAIRFALKVLKENRWIPVEEKLPQDGVWVLAQVLEEGEHLWVPQIMCYQSGMHDWYCDLSNIGYLGNHIHDYKVIAWRPLPEYQVGSPT